MTQYAGCVKPTMKQSLTLFLSVLNFLKKNRNDGMIGWERLSNGILVKRKALMFPRNDMKTDLYLIQSFKVLWDFNIQTDNVIEQRRPDMIIMDKTSKKTQIVNFDVPTNHWIKISQQNKIDNFQDLKRELQKLWNLKTSIVPIVIVGLRTILKSIEKHLNELNLEVNT